MAALVLVTLSYHSDPGQEMSFPQKLLMEVVGGFQSGMSASARTIEDFWRNYFDLAGVREDNRRLKEALDRSRDRLNSLREDQQENRRLIKLLTFTSRHDYKVIGAQVVGWDPGPWLKTLTLNRGERDGVKTAMPVVSHQGVVGRVVDVSPHFARVLLLVDYNSSIDAIVQRSRVRGILTGTGEKNCVLEYVRKGDEPRVGDVVVTSGMGGAFPRGLLLGTIGGLKSIGYESFLRISVSPAVDFSQLEEVLIVTNKLSPFAEPSGGGRLDGELKREPTP